MTSPIRLQSDLERLRALAAASGERIVHLAGPTVASPRANLEFRYAIARSERYPNDVTRQTRLAITLPDRYPFQPPVASVLTPVWHPNVFPSGTICIGTKWLPSEGLDLFVQRLARLLTYDALLVNIASPAHAVAAQWYEQARRRHPAAFPTDQPVFDAAYDVATRGQHGPRVGWRDTTVADDRVERPCPNCARTLRLPRGRSGRVRCPACGAAFEAET
jgi:ubiquitin-protein ligase